MLDALALLFLNHPGECASLLRAGHGWREPHAPRPSAWPTELKVLAGLMLGSKEPMFIAWGPQRLMVYNDAYRAILGTRHPAAMGQPLQAVWHDIWDDIGPSMAKVFAGERVQMDNIQLRLQPDGPLQDSQFSFGYHPVCDSQGQVVGLLCVCREIITQLPEQRRREEEWSRRWGMFAQAPGFVAILRGPQHHFEFVNRAFEEAFGPREIAGLSVADVLPEAVSHGFVQQLDHVFATGQRYAGRKESLVLRTPGEPDSQRYLDFIFEPLMDDDDVVTGIFVQGHDVTQLHLAEAAAQSSNQRYATLLDSMSEGMVMLDADFRVVQINREGLRLAGRAEHDIVGRLPWDMWPAEMGAALEAACREATSQRAPRQLEHSYISDAHSVWLSIRIYPVPGGLAVLYRDISGFKRAEAALRQSEERFKAAVSAVGVMWTNNAQGEMCGEQPGWAQITGQTAQEYSGHRWTQALHPDDAEPTLRAWRDAVADKRDFSFEHRVRSRSGEWRRYTVRAVPILASDGSIREWVGVHVDATDAREAAETLRSAARRKDEFLAILAHELRNPLAPIRSAAHALGQPDITTQELAACRGIILRQGQHMARLLDDLLDVSRITSGRLALQKVYRPLRDIVTTAIETARPLLDAKGHTLTLELPQHDIDVEVDELRLSQVLSNLLLNAAKYSDQGGHIWLTARTDAEELLIEVRDEGIGIAPEHLRHVFDMFSQLRGSKDRSLGGLGIGLALSRGLIELHGGRLDAASPGLGRGARFTVRLPAALMDSQPMPLHDQLAPTQPRPSTPRTVLIADDNTDAAESLCLLLELEGHQVHMAADGASALAMAARVRPQVAVLDIGMPGMDGHELAHQLRLHAWGPGMLIVAVTGWGQQEDQRRALAAGFDRHFTKPVDPDVLLQCIANWQPPRTSDA